MMTQLTWKDIKCKTDYLIEAFGLSSGDALRFEQLTDFCRRVGHAEGRTETLHSLSKTIASELEKE